MQTEHLILRHLVRLRLIKTFLNTFFFYFFLKPYYAVVFSVDHFYLLLNDHEISGGRDSQGDRRIQENA